MLVFDVETVALPDVVPSSPDEVLAFSPCTSRAVVIALRDTERRRTCALVLDDDGEALNQLRGPWPDDWRINPYVDEADMLRAFWAIAAKYSAWGSYNGRCFDVPFLAMRSLFVGVNVHRPLVDSHRYNGAHFDAFDRVTGFGAARQMKLSLGRVAVAMGIASPKTEMAGADVEAAWRGGRRADVVRYCIGDAHTTAQVVAAWNFSMTKMGNLSEVAA